MLDTGSKLPSFHLQNQDGVARTLADYSGKWLVLYVYPKDDTASCTIQGRSFTATKADFEAKNAVVVGVSADDVGSHRAFCDKFSFTIELLADPKTELLQALGIGQKEVRGTMYWLRTTFVVDTQGVIRREYPTVDPNGHEQVLLKDLAELQG